MRATGFFFSTDSQTFLVTARHNILPTDVSVTNPNGESTNLYSTELTLPQVDVFVDAGEDFEQHQYDIREAVIRQTPGIDAIGIQVNFEPESYGYRVWKEDDIVTGISEAEELEVIGFDGKSFPDSECDFSTEIYCREISNPGRLNLHNPLPNCNTSELGLELVAVDEQYEGKYNGLSGSPVLGHELAGIHVADIGTQSLEADYGEIRRTVYVRSAVLPKLLG